MTSKFIVPQFWLLCKINNNSICRTYSNDVPGTIQITRLFKNTTKILVFLPSGWVVVDVAVPSKDLNSVECHLCGLFCAIEDDGRTVLPADMAIISGLGYVVQVAPAGVHGSVHVSHFGLWGVQNASSEFGPQVTKRSILLPE